MSSKQSSKKSTKTTEPVVAAVAPAPVPAPVEEKPKAKRASKKTEVEPEVAPAPASSPAPVSAPETVTMSVEPLPEAEQANVEATADVESKCSKFYTELQEISGKLSQMKALFKSIERDYGKKLKTASKGQGKKKSGNRAPSGFVKPTKISDELAIFLGKPAGTKMARTEVTREINIYIKNNNLQDDTNGRQINANPALSALLKLNEGDVLTYFNLQKYMSPHFTKSTPAPAEV
jgi:chromatin remodeling complex protein RSC6